MPPFETLGRACCLFTALVVWPVSYLVLLRRMKRSRISKLPYVELFIGFGVIGGFLLCTALATNSPLGIILLGFQIFIATPAALFCLLSLLLGFARSRFHTITIILLAAGIVAPFADLALDYLQS